MRTTSRTVSCPTCGAPAVLQQTTRHTPEDDVAHVEFELSCSHGHLIKGDARGRKGSPGGHEVTESGPR